MTQVKTRKQRVMFTVEQKLDYVKLILTVLFIGNCPDKKSTEVHFWRRYLFEDMIA